MNNNENAKSKDNEYNNFNDDKKPFLSNKIAVIMVVVITLLANSVVHNLYNIYFCKDAKYENKLEFIRKLVDENYAGEIDKEKLYEGIYTGALAFSTDKYSRYISAEDYKSFKIDTTGNYAGIGVKTMVDTNTPAILIISIYENSPAEKAGLKVGDKITKIDDMVVTLDNYDQAINNIRGHKGESVVFTVNRNDKVFEATVVRDEVDIPTVGGAVVADDIGYIKLDGFESVTYEQFKVVLNDLKKENITKLIIDLRNNPGGLLDSVSAIADEIIPKGVITYMEDKNGKKEYIYSEEGELNMPLVVLVNENSASAAELLTAAVKDTKKGTIVGENTYGKGVVQTTFPLNDGSAVKLTTAKYFTPNGVCIDGVGIAPDVEVKASKDYILPILLSDKASCDLINDVQLIKAIEILNS